MKEFFKRIFHKNKHVLKGYVDEKNLSTGSIRKCGVYQEINYSGEVVKTYIKSRNCYNDIVITKIDTIAYDRDNLIIHC